MFADRKDAGQKLGRALEKYKDCRGVVLAIPKGGIEVGYYVAEYLRMELAAVMVRKLPLPDNPEAGFGAIAEDGSIYFVDRIANMMPDLEIERILEKQKNELVRRINVLRHGRSLPELSGRTVIVTDDGIAMGSTMQAAIALCKKHNAEKIIAAAPVSGRTIAQEISKKVDETVILEKPLFFRAVADAYENWYDVTDEEAKNLLQKSTINI